MKGKLKIAELKKVCKDCVEVINGAEHCPPVCEHCGVKALIGKRKASRRPIATRV